MGWNCIISSSLPQDPSRAETTTGACVVLAQQLSWQQRPVKERNTRDLLTCTDLGYALVRNNILFPLLLSQRHCWLSLPMAQATPRKPVWNLRLFPLQAGGKVSQPRERQGALERDCLCFCHWCHSGFFREFFSWPILYYQPDDSWVSLRPLLFFFISKTRSLKLCSKTQMFFFLLM